jgi:hypothetical protein
MSIAYWLVLFSISCLANMLGLNISSAFNSVVTIYILIPFIIIPQLLFSGVLVKFDWLRSHTPASYEYVPVIGDLIPARWAFEALAVEQFKNNKFERNFFSYDAGISQNDWYSVFLINQNLKYDLWKCNHYKDSTGHRDDLENSFYKINYYIDRLNELAGFSPIQDTWKDSLTIELFDATTAARAEHHLDSLASHFRSVRKAFKILKDSVERNIGRERYNEMKDKYTNKRLTEFVLNEEAKQKSIETDHKIIQKYEPAFMSPVSKFGRGQFYIPLKQVGAITIDTFWFNIIVLWLVTLVLYTALYYKLLMKALTFIGSLRVPKQEN